MSYVDEIIKALGGVSSGKEDTVSSAEKKNIAQRIADALPSKTGLQWVPFPEPMKDNVEVTDDVYLAPSGFAVDDVLVPNKPNIDWTEYAPLTPADLGLPGVSFAGGMAIDPMQELSANNMLPEGGAASLEELDILPARQRRSGLSTGLLMASDAIRRAYGSDIPLGSALERANQRDAAIANADAEGKEIDLQRAKVLSQRAYQEQDPEKKAILGRAIKKLLPRETAGLDDITAADMFTTSEKMDLERLKAANAYALQQLKGAQKAEQLGITGQQKEDLATLQGDIKRGLQAEKLASDYQRSMDVEAARQAGQTTRTEKQQAGALERVQAQQAGALARTEAQQAGALKRVEAQQAGALARAQTTATKKDTAAGGTDLIEQRTSPEAINKMKALNKAAGRWATEGLYRASALANKEDAKAYQEFEGLAKQIVQDQLRKIYGAQFTEKEGERFFKSMGLNQTLDSDVRWALFENAINDLRAKGGYGPIGVKSSAKTIKPGTVYKGYRFKGGNPKDKNNWEKA